MEIIRGRKYYQKDEFAEEILKRVNEAGRELGIKKPADVLSVAPALDAMGQPLGIRMYDLDGWPIFNTYVNENGFYFLKPVK